jgi:branched-chain amino acid transport system ATP-binding protein
VLLVEQNATMALGVSDLAFVLDVGEVSLSGPSRELAASDEVQHLYLGHGSGAEDDAEIHRKVVTTTKTLTRWVG